MKKLVFVMAVVLNVLMAAQAQTNVSFKIKMMPNHVYTSTMRMDMVMRMAPPPDSSKNRVTAALASTDIKMDMNVNSVATTGKVNPQMVFRS